MAAEIRTLKRINGGVVGTRSSLFSIESRDFDREFCLDSYLEESYDERLDMEQSGMLGKIRAYENTIKIAWYGNRRATIIDTGVDGKSEIFSGTDRLDLIVTNQTEFWFGEKGFRVSFIMDGASRI